MALAALYTLLRRPDLFALGLLESTSLQVGNGELLRESESLFQGPDRVSVGVGQSEVNVSAEFAQKAGIDVAAGNAGFAHASEKLAANLKVAEINRPDVMFVSTPGAHHEEKAWAARFPAVIQFLFPSTQAK